MSTTMNEDMTVFKIKNMLLGGGHLMQKELGLGTAAFLLCPYSFHLCLPYFLVSFSFALKLFDR